MSKKRSPKSSGSDVLTALREEVKHQLQRCCVNVHPAITARLSDVDGYKQVEEAVIGLVLRQHITPGAAVNLLESEWGGI